MGWITELERTTETVGLAGVVSVESVSLSQAESGKRNAANVANVRDRLLLLHDVQARFQTVFKDGVFQVRMEIPA